MSPEQHLHRDPRGHEYPQSAANAQSGRACTAGSNARSIQFKASLIESKVTLNDTKLTLNDTKLSLDDTKLTLNDTKESLDDTKLSLNDLKETLNGTKLGFDASRLRPGRARPAQGLPTRRHDAPNHGAMVTHSAKPAATLMRTPCAKADIYSAKKLAGLSPRTPCAERARVGQ